MPPDAQLAERLRRIVLARRVYKAARKAVIDAGWAEDLEWQATRRPEHATEHDFLREAAHVIANSGMRGTVIRKLWPTLRATFRNFQSARVIVTERAAIRAGALAILNHEQKIDAMIGVAFRVFESGWDEVYGALQQPAPEALEYLRRFGYVGGPVLAYHLGKNLGLEVAKPDRHLVRIAELFGYDDVQAFCRACAGDSEAGVVGDRVGVVDLVWWRYAANVAPKTYLERLRGAMESA